MSPFSILNDDAYSTHTKLQSPRVSPLSNWQQRSCLREGRAEEAANAPLFLPQMSSQSAHWELVAEVAQLSGVGWQFT